MKINQRHLKRFKNNLWKQHKLANNIQNKDFVKYQIFQTKWNKFKDSFEKGVHDGSISNDIRLFSQGKNFIKSYNEILA